MQSAMAPADPMNNKRPDGTTATDAKAKAMDDDASMGGNMGVDEDAMKINTLQAAKGRIRSAPSRSGSGAEPPAPKKPNVEESPPPPPPGSLRTPPLPASSADSILDAITALSKEKKSKTIWFQKWIYKILKQLLAKILKPIFLKQWTH